MLVDKLIHKLCKKNWVIIILIIQSCIHMYMYICIHDCIIRIIITQFFLHNLCMSLSTNIHRPNATGNCTFKVTSCMAAYYSMNERPPPPRCTRRNMCAGLTREPLEKCLKKWASCVKKAFKAQHGKVCICTYY